MEKLENRHDLDTQTATFEQIGTDNALSLADLHKRNLERSEKYQKYQKEHYTPEPHYRRED